MVTKLVVSMAPRTARARTEILISGFGGQGVVRLAQMLKSHGTETRGGYVRAQIVISPSYVDSPVVEAADYFIALSQPAYSRFLELARGTVLYDPEFVTSVRPESPVRHLAVPATKLSQEAFKNGLFANIIVLGVLARESGLDPAALRETLVSVLPRYHNENLQALDIGYQLDLAG